MTGICRGQKRALDVLELELNHLVGAMEYTDHIFEFTLALFCERYQNIVLAFFL